MPDYNQPEYVHKRLRYFHGQFLQDQDFIDEQKYHVDRQRRLGRLFHGPGVVEGLAVTALTTEGAAVRVAPGTALDSSGRLIVSGGAEVVRLDDHLGTTVQL